MTATPLEIARAIAKSLPATSCRGRVYAAEMGAMQIHVSDDGGAELGHLTVGVDRRVSENLRSRRAELLALAERAAARLV